MPASVEKTSTAIELRRTAHAPPLEMATAKPLLTVLMMPDYRHDNPYQTLLAKAIEADCCRVEFPRGYRRIFPIYRALRDHRSAKALHLHWTAQYLRGKNRFAFLAWTAKFLADLLLVRISGRRIVWTMHNLVPHETRFPRLEIFARRWLCRLASAVIVHGTIGREDAIRRIGCRAEKVHVVPQGNYIDAFPAAPAREEALQQLGLKPHRKTFLFFGLVRPYKGIPALLAAWKKLAPQDAQLIIAGGSLPDYRAEVRTLVADVPGAIWHDAWISNEQLPSYFVVADVVVLPFERVLTSASVMLAMGYGKPIIAPRLGEIPETMVGADDLMYPPGDSTALETCIARAMQTDLSELASRTLEAAKRFDWSVIGRTTANIYREAVGQTADTKKPS